MRIHEPVPGLFEEPSPISLLKMPMVVNSGAMGGRAAGV